MKTRKAVRIVLECPPRRNKKKRLKGFEVWADVNTEGFGESQEERQSEVMCARRALEVMTANLAHTINMPVEAFMQQFTNEVIRIYCNPQK